MSNPHRNDERLRLSIHHALIGIGVIAILLVAGQYAVRTYDSAFKSLENFSSIWLTHDMLVIYMNRNEGHWPTDWDELNSAFAEANSGYGAPDLTWVKERITIDFNVDPTTPPATNDPRDHQLHAIRLADGTQSGETQDANARLKSAMYKWTSRGTIAEDGT